MALQVFYGGTFDPVHAGHLAMAEAAAVALGVPVRMMPAADPPHRALPGASAAQRAAMLDLAVEGQPMLRVDRRELARSGRSYTIDTLRELRAQYGPEAPLAFVIGADSLRALHTWQDWRQLLEGAHLVVAERPGSSLDDLVAEPGHAPPRAASASGYTAGTGAERAAGPVAVPAMQPAPQPASQPATGPDGTSALVAALCGRWAASPDPLLHSPGGRVLRLRQPLHPASASEIRRRIAAGDPGWSAWLPPAVAGYIRHHRLYGCDLHGGDAPAPDGDDGTGAPVPDPHAGPPAASAL